MRAMYSHHVARAVVRKYNCRVLITIGFRSCIDPWEYRYCYLNHPLQKRIKTEMYLSLGTYVYIKSIIVYHGYSVI